MKTAMIEGVHTGSTDSLGIHLSAADVADAIIAAVDLSGLVKSLAPGAFSVGDDEGGQYGQPTGAAAVTV